MKIRHASEIQCNKNKTFSIKLNHLINVVANIFHKITKLLYFHFKIFYKAIPPNWEKQKTAE
jgi:hypothetical protein